MPSLYFDTETHRIVRPHLAPRPVCVQWAIDDGPIHVALFRDAPIREWLADTTLVWEGAHTAFDLAVLLYAGYDQVVELATQGRVRDVLLDARIDAIRRGVHLDIFPRSLAGLAELRGVALEKSQWRLRYSELDGVPVEYWPTGALSYAREDVEQTRIEARVWPDTQSGRLAASSDLSLYLASCYGVHTDASRCDALLREATATIDTATDTIRAHGLLRSDGTQDTQAAAERMYAFLGERCALTDTGVELVKAGTLTRAEALIQVRRGRRLIKLDADECEGSGDPVLGALSTYKSAESIRTRALTMCKGVDLPLQTSFDSIKDTFRTSSRIPTISDIVGCQMQNFPRSLGLREVFAPRPGNTFISCDVSIAELHSLAELTHHMFGYSEMGRRLNAGEDLHYAFAAVSKGVTYADMVATRDKEARGAAKAYNFGLPGGLGVATFCKLAAKNYGVVLTPSEAEPQIALWFRTFPEVREYLRWISSQVSDIERFTFTHPLTGFTRGGCTYTSGANFGFQHLTAWAMKVALVEVTRRAFDPTSPLYGFRMWNFVHDEILCEGPRDRAQVAALELARVTAECFNTFVPTFPTTCDPVVSDVWSKSAESPIGPDGLPTPWSPAES